MLCELIAGTDGGGLVCAISYENSSTKVVSEGFTIFKLLSVVAPFTAVLRGPGPSGLE